MNCSTLNFWQPHSVYLKFVVRITLVVPITLKLSISVSKFSVFEGQFKQNFLRTKDIFLQTPYENENIKGCLQTLCKKCWFQASSFEIFWELKFPTFSSAINFSTPWKIQCQIFKSFILDEVVSLHGVL